MHERADAEGVRWAGVHRGVLAAAAALYQIRQENSGAFRAYGRDVGVGRGVDAGGSRTPVIVQNVLASRSNVVQVTG